MKRIIILEFFLIVLFYQGIAQESIILKGRVINFESEEGVSFAHVGLCGKAIGTISNEEGYFELKIAPYLINDTLCISAIGFKTFRKVINNIPEFELITVKLVPQTSVLQDVIISDKRITGRRVVEKAISRIYKNHPLKPFVIEGYYRDYLKRNNQYTSFLEAALTVQDMGYKRSDGKTRVVLNQMRFQDNYDENYKKYLYKDENDTLKEVMAGVSTEFFANEFYNMRYHNPVRNQNEMLPFVGVFHNFSESNYDFKIAYYTYVENDEVYVIHFKPKAEYNYLHINVVGEIFIRVKDHAILKFHYSFFVRDFTNERKVYELDLEYRDYQGKLFLKYLSYVNFFKIYLGYEIGEIQQYREFFVTDIHYPEIADIPKEASIDKQKPLHLITVEEDPDFWDNYNRILLTKPYKD
jgi:hypothetical protein